MPLELTNMQKIFLDALYEDAKGDVKQAMKIAGYAASTPISHVIEPLAEEIVKRGQAFMSAHVPKATLRMLKIIDDASELGSAVSLAASKEVLDRGGLAKKESLSISAEGVTGIFLLPAKSKD